MGIWARPVKSLLSWTDSSSSLPVGRRPHIDTRNPTFFDVITLAPRIDRINDRRYRWSGQGLPRREKIKVTESSLNESRKFTAPVGVKGKMFKFTNSYWY